MNRINTVVIEEDRENIKKIENYCKKKKNIELLGKVGNSLTKVGSPVLIGSVLSPFDFEGPIIEIISGVIVLCGIIMKEVSKSKLEKIKAINTDGVSYTKHKLDEDDAEIAKDNLCKIINNARTMKNERAGLQK